MFFQVQKRQALIPFPRTGKRSALIPFPRTGKRASLPTTQQVSLEDMSMEDVPEYILG